MPATICGLLDGNERIQVPCVRCKTATAVQLFIHFRVHAVCCVELFRCLFPVVTGLTAECLKCCKEVKSPVKKVRLQRAAAERSTFTALRCSMPSLRFSRSGQGYQVD